MSPGTTRARNFRADIEGLRAIAVGLVVIYHLWPNRLPGGFVGVDVFFVISGYLITSHLISRPPRNLADLGAFWARRARRLLPASLTVLLAVLVASRLIGSETQWRTTATDVIAATFYGVNWKFAADSVDYLAAQEAASPVQHFWSLSLEEQFYLFWPILVLLAFHAARTWTRSSIRPLILVVCAASFGVGAWLSFTDPASAYFVTHTRIWELAVGGLVASTVPLAERPIPRWVSGAAAWAGIAAVAAAGLLLTSSLPYPGFAALLPVLGTALVIWSQATGASTPDGVLGVAPIQWAGGVSYAIYLWHWPLIVFAEELQGHRTLATNLVILALTLALAALSKRFIEDRFRRPRGLRPTRRALLTAAAGMALVGVLGAGQIVETRVSEDRQQAQLDAIESGDCFGAMSLASPAECADMLGAAAAVSPATASEDKPVLYDDGCLVKSPYELKTCTYGDGDVDVALVGNSHAGQWLAPLMKMAGENNLRITTYLASTCNATETRLQYGGAETADNCHRWGQDVLKATSGDAYDLVITTQRNVLPAEGHSADDSYQAWFDGYRSYLERWASAKTNLLVLHDTPFPGATLEDVPECLAQNEDDPDACSGAADTWIPEDPLFDAAGDVAGVERATLNEYICEPSRCRSVVGAAIVYFDESHLTETYSASMSPVLERVVRESLPR